MLTYKHPSATANPYAVSSTSVVHRTSRVAESTVAIREAPADTIVEPAAINAVPAGTEGTSHSS